MKEKEILLFKYGEVTLKGLNKAQFEIAMIKTVRRRLQDLGEFKVYRAQSTLYAEPMEDGIDMDAALKRAQNIFGFSAINRAHCCEKDIDAICRTAEQYYGERLSRAKTFKVAAKRSDKSFPLNSQEIGRDVGGYLLGRHPPLEVRMHEPEVTVVVEVRDFAAYVHDGKIRAAGGMPTGTSGRAAVLMSGGIDSPVAAYTTAKRGMDLCGIHFMSPPYTSERALEKVVTLSRRIADYTGNFALLCVPFAEVQLEIGRKCPEELFTVLMRRSMMRIATELAKRESCGALITGESLAQVASQTLSALVCTEDATDMLVLRPLIGMDKLDIIDIAREIGTYDTSILPYEDCCTVFTPKHPKTKPKLEDVIKAEQGAELAPLEADAVKNTTVKMIHFFDKE